MLSQAADEKTGRLEPVGNTPSWALHYKSFLVRIWREREIDPWRASVTSVRTSETHNFADVGAMFAFLHEQLTAVPGDK